MFFFAYKQPIYYTSLKQKQQARQINTYKSIMDSLFTIGHSNQSEQEFIALLTENNISAIADVRSQPYSQYTPHFNRNALEKILRETDIQYVFLGRELGARRHEEACYLNGRAKYEMIARQPLFREGLERLFQGCERYRVAVMCSEADPITCHRTILICREIKRLRPGMPIHHILGDGTTETHEEALERLVELHKLQPELFGDLTSASSLIEKAYELQAAKLEYQTGQAEE